MRCRIKAMEECTGKRAQIYKLFQRKKTQCLVSDGMGGNQRV